MSSQSVETKILRKDIKFPKVKNKTTGKEKKVVRYHQSELRAR